MPSNLISWIEVVEWIISPGYVLNRHIAPSCSSRSQLTITLAKSRPDDEFIDLTAYSIMGMIIKYILFWNLNIQGPLIGKHCSLNFIKGEFFVGITTSNFNILFFTTQSQTNDKISVKIIKLAEKHPVLVPLLLIWDHACFNKWIPPIINSIDSSNNSLQTKCYQGVSAIKSKRFQFSRWFSEPTDFCRHLNILDWQFGELG